MVQHNESVHDYRDDVKRMYGIAKPQQNFNDEEKATKLANELTKQLFKDVRLMNPILPADFLTITAKAIDLPPRANQRNRPNRDTVLPCDMTNPLEAAVDHGYRSGYTSRINENNKRNGNGNNDNSFQKGFANNNCNSVLRPN